MKLSPETTSILDDCRSAAEALVEEFTAAGVFATTAESCTGGMISGMITSIPGASSMFNCGYVTYSNAAKSTMLGVKPATLERYGAVSPQTAREMAAGALAAAQADFAVAATGIAGPNGGSAEKPVGLVYLGIARAGSTPTAMKLQWPEDWSRDLNTFASVHAALEALREALREPSSG
ncbi:CinA family protein [Pseudohoeflea coraliihabitans]|uniref:CinA family protein n=1 Tax=Pseudohoeflea coraliihabitans TaxID=2860393 RepID=A0ABS6WTR8_9HYPH|nr:CinA family protein [Pseudohoeflea sp. DP4N28-3]MBW3098460.1 CinA family protein [Pseudohoeflea sp. DP4N28-3]